MPFFTSLGPTPRQCLMSWVPEPLYSTCLSIKLPGQIEVINSFWYFRSPLCTIRYPLSGILTSLSLYTSVTYPSSSTCTAYLGAKPSFSPQALVKMMRAPSVGLEGLRFTTTSLAVASGA